MPDGRLVCNKLPYSTVLSLYRLIHTVFFPSYFPVMTTDWLLVNIDNFNVCHNLFFIIKFRLVPGIIFLTYDFVCPSTRSKYSSRLLFPALKGNSYYIPHANSQGLNTMISLQTSRDQKGGTKETSARYATAWLNHGVNPTDQGYEYTIMVDKPLNYIQVNDLRCKFFYLSFL